MKDRERLERRLAWLNLQVYNSKVSNSSSDPPLGSAISLRTPGTGTEVRLLLAAPLHGENYIEAQPRH